MVAIGFSAPLAGLKTYKVREFAIWMVIFGLLGSRLLYVILHHSLYFEKPLRILKFWEGGLVFHGGLITAIIVAFIALRISKGSFLQMGDALAPALSLGQGVGRLGCLLEGCCYGRHAGDNFPISLVFPRGGGAPYGTPLYPTQAMESLGLFILTFALFMILRRNLRPCGLVLGAYLLGAGLLRFSLEFLRGDDRGPLLLGYPPTTYVAALLAAAGVIVILYVYGKAKKFKNITNTEA
jgi:phosphatidylglycerol:prolipoprotein diacylglycerol transferase